MTLTHYIGGKIVGDSTDFASLSVNYPEFSTFIDSETFIEYILVAGVWEKIGITLPVGGWKEIGRTTLGSTGDLIDVTGLEALGDKRYLMYLSDLRNSGTIANFIRHNNDAGTNYARRFSLNGATDGTAINNSDGIEFSTNGVFPQFGVGYEVNFATKEKLWTGHVVGQNTAGAGNVPARFEGGGKWANAVNAISSTQYRNLGAGDFDIGSEVVVLEWDPDDTHVDNFWEELVSKTDGSGTIIDTGTFTAKKYLWYQVFAKKSVTGDVRFQFNNDTGLNYAQRVSNDGSTDFTNGGLDRMNVSGNQGITGVDNAFCNGFIINNLANEKLLTGNAMWKNTSGAGTAPVRAEVANKWANTVAQITSIQLVGTTFDSGTIIKVWGHD